MSYLTDNAKVGNYGSGGALVAVNSHIFNCTFSGNAASASGVNVLIYFFQPSRELLNWTRVQQYLP